MVDLLIGIHIPEQNSEAEIEFSVVNTPCSTENSTLKDKKNDGTLEE